MNVLLFGLLGLAWCLVAILVHDTLRVMGPGRTTLTGLVMLTATLAAISLARASW